MFATEMLRTIVILILTSLAILSIEKSKANEAGQNAEYTIAQRAIDEFSFCAEGDAIIFSASESSTRQLYYRAERSVVEEQEEDERHHNSKKSPSVLYQIIDISFDQLLGLAASNQQGLTQQNLSCALELTGKRYIDIRVFRI